MEDVIVRPLALGTIQTAGATPAPLRFIPIGKARVRDNFWFPGLGVISGTVKRKDTPANVALRRRVRLYRERDGLLVQETWSEAATGAYVFTDLSSADRYTALAYDYEHDFRAVAADNLAPEGAA